VGYSDADWAGDIVTRRSTSGYVLGTVDFETGVLSMQLFLGRTCAYGLTIAFFMHVRPRKNCIDRTPLSYLTVSAPGLSADRPNARVQSRCQLVKPSNVTLSYIVAVVQDEQRWSRRADELILDTTERLSTSQGPAALVAYPVKVTLGGGFATAIHPEDRAESGCRLVPARSSHYSDSNSTFRKLLHRSFPGTVR
jgi:hypothetical protein